MAVDLLGRKQPQDIGALCRPLTDDQLQRVFDAGAAGLDDAGMVLVKTVCRACGGPLFLPTPEPSVMALRLAPLAVHDGCS